MPRMSDFFGSLNYGNVRFTDARINGDGPLPTSISGPEGVNGDPDGRYNFNDALLSSIAPYAGPKEGRMGSDRNYQQIPHRKQYPVPKIYLPEPAWDTSATFDMSHPIDMGDLVFIVNMHYKHYVLTGSQASVADAQNNTMPNYNVFCNICTVNYLLAGIHNYAVHYIRGNNNVNKTTHAWYQLMRCLSLDQILETIRTRFQAFTSSPVSDPEKQDYESEVILMLKLMLQQLIRDNIKPLGICSTSEKQGGQHETGYKPVQAAASFYVTLTVDGQNRDLVNIWRGVDVEGGDLLLVQLEYNEKPAGHSRISQPYTLNHYYKAFVQRSVQMHDSVEGLFQLVPGVWRTAFKPTKTPANISPTPDKCAVLTRNWKAHAVRAPVAGVFACRFRLNAGLPDDIEEIKHEILEAMLDSVMDNRNLGYWHIGQVYNKQGKFAAETVPTDDMEMTKGQLLQVNFAPVWHGRMLGEAETITKRIVTPDAALARNVANLRAHHHALSLFLLETHTEWTVWFDLTMWALHIHTANAANPENVRLIGAFINTHLTDLIRRRAAVLAAGHAPQIPPLSLHTGAATSVLGSMQALTSLGTGDAAAGPAAGGEAAASEAAASAPAAGDAQPPVKRFKKSASVAEPAEGGASAPAAPAATAAPAAAPAAAADSAGWDFEKDLENIFATEAQARADGADKARGKGKAKGV